MKGQNRLDPRKYSFSQRPVNEWKELTADCVKIYTVNEWKELSALTRGHGFTQ